MIVETLSCGMCDTGWQRSWWVPSPGWKLEKEMALTHFRYRWRTGLSSIIETSKSRTASLSARKPIEPCDAANHIQSSGSGEMLQMGSLQPNIARTAQTHDSNPVRNGALNPRSLGIGVGEFLGCFPLSPLLQGQVLLLWTNRHGAACMATGMGTQRARRAHLAVCGGELDLDHLVGPVVNGRSPTEAFASLRARGLLVLPIDEKVIGIEASRLASLAIDGSGGLDPPGQSGSPAGSPPGVARPHSPYRRCAKPGKSSLRSSSA